MRLLVKPLNCPALRDDLTLDGVDPREDVEQLRARVARGFGIQQEGEAVGRLLFRGKAMQGEKEKPLHVRH